MDIFLLTALAVTCVISWAILYRYRDDLEINAISAAVLAVLHTAAGVLCVKLFAGMESLSDPLSSGMSLFGALFFLPVFYIAGAKITKRDPKLVFDDFGLLVMTALMCVRVNCIISGCCLGRYITGTEMRWPTRETEIVFWAVLLVCSIYQKEHGYVKGTIYPLMLMIYGMFRFVIELLREGTPVLGPFHIANIWACLSFVIGSTIYFMMTERERSLRRRR